MHPPELCLKYSIRRFLSCKLEKFDSMQSKHGYLSLSRQLNYFQRVFFFLVRSLTFRRWCCFASRVRWTVENTHQTIGASVNMTNEKSSKFRNEKPRQVYIGWWWKKKADRKENGRDNGSRAVCVWCVLSPFARCPYPKGEFMVLMRVYKPFDFSTRAVELPLFRNHHLNNESTEFIPNHLKMHFLVYKKKKTRPDFT